MITRWAHAIFAQCFYSLCVFVTRCQIYTHQQLLRFSSLFSPSTQLFSHCTTIYRISSLVFAIVFSLVSTPASALDARFFSGNYIEHFDPDAATCSTSSTSSSDGSSGTAAEDLKDFVRKYVKMAVETNKKYGTPYETVLAQGVIESGYGKSGLTVKANNFHGIKAGGNWSGEVIDMETEEEYASGRTTIVDGFRKYPTVEAGWLGYGEFITSNSRYSEALKYPGDPRKYLQEIKNAGYATDSQYVSTVTEYIDKIEQIVKEENLSPPSSQIQVEGGNNNGANTQNASAAGCTANGSKSAAGGSIVETAKSLAWEDGRRVGNGGEKEEYRNARQQHNPEAGGDYTDCGKYVSTVMRMSGADPNYPPAGTVNQRPYVLSHPEKYYTKESPSMSDLQPGDILVFNGHTLFYLGDLGNGFVGAQASQYDHVPSYINQGTIEWMLGNSGVVLARTVNGNTQSKT